MYRFLLLITITLLSAACSQTPQIDPPETLETNSSPPDSWVIVGKMAFKSPQRQGTVTVNWQQKQDNYRIQISAPFGQGSAVVYGDQSTITIEQAGKSPLTSDDTDNFIHEALGLPLPLEDFLFWIQGTPNPNSAVNNHEYFSSGKTKRFEQTNWTVQLSRHKLIDQWFLPGKIIATQDDKKIVLIVSQWQFL